MGAAAGRSEGDPTITGHVVDANDAIVAQIADIDAIVAVEGDLFGVRERPLGGSRGAIRRPVGAVHIVNADDAVSGHYVDSALAIERDPF